VVERESMSGIHDLGGSPGAGPIDKSQHELEDWERLADAVTVVLDQKGIKTTDEHRRAQESLAPELYRSLSYYERWTAATEMLLIEKGILTREEIDAESARIRHSWDKG
jgi:nitrile hydratase